MRPLRHNRRDPGNLSIPLPPYPVSPASLTAAITFYNAARQEINDRVKFRDQVIIAIIGATFGILGLLNPFDSKGAFAPVAPTGVSLGDVALAMVVVTAATALVINFACRYCGYQNAKIAELGYFITDKPAYHLQAYALHELLSKPIADGQMAARPEVSRIGLAHEKLRGSFTHWDGWAAAKMVDEAGVWPRPPSKRSLKKEFSQDGVYRMLLTQFSLLPSAMLVIAGIKIVGSMPRIVLPTLPQAFLFVVAIAIALWIPVRVWRMIDRAEELKKYYSDLRRGVDVAGMFDPA